MLCAERMGINVYVYAQSAYLVLSNSTEYDGTCKHYSLVGRSGGVVTISLLSLHHPQPLCGPLRGTVSW